MYLLFLIGCTCALLAITQIILIASKIKQKKDNFRLHIVLAISFIVLTMICSGYGTYSVIKIITNHEATYEISRELGRSAAGITSGIINGFQEGMNTTDENQSPSVTQDELNIQ